MNMTKDQLTIIQTLEMFLFVAKRMVDSKDILTEADKKQKITISGYRIYCS